MKKIGNVQVLKNALLGAFSLMLVLTLAFATNIFSMVSYAQSEGKVTASSAKIREKADSTSNVLGSAQKDAEVTINGQTKDSQGYTWYQVFVDANTLGFIRSDLVKITDGTTPATLTDTGSSNNANTNSNQNTNTNETPADVSPVNPISGTVTGGQNVRVRANASTTSEIKTTAQNGMALTVVGTATGTDNKEWYQVKFAVDGSEITGFVRSDYVNLSGELTPYVEEPVSSAPEQDAPQDNNEVSVSKDWETQLQGEDWYLIDNKAPGQYKIADMFSAVENNSKLYLQEKQSNKNLTAVVVILVIVIIALAAAVTYLIFKLKEINDSAYFAEVERETIRRRSADRPQGQRAVQPENREKQSTKMAQGGSRTAQQSQGVRPAQGPKSVQGARPIQAPGQTPQGRMVPGEKRPMQQPQGARPVQAPGQTPQGRPAQGEKRPMQQPQGARTAQGSKSAQMSRPAQAPGQAPQGRPVQGGPRPAQAAPQRQPGAQNPNFKSKNFLADDDEFEFEFLNWDGDEEE